MHSSPHNSKLRRLAKEEGGAAYTLSYVMVIPVYALLVCMIIETALVLVAKVGTVYAGYAAARSASVWSAHTTWEKTQEKAKQAAVTGMLPFASGTQPLSATGAISGKAAAHLTAYQLYAKSPVSTKYFMSKYGYASQATKVTIEGRPASWDEDIKAKIEYEHPINVPGIGRMFGKRRLQGYVITLTTEVTLQNEGPQNDSKTLGIGYGTLE